MNSAPQPPKNPTTFVRSKVGKHLQLCWTNHAKERMAERGLTMSDVLHVLKHGYIYEPGEPATQQGLFKFKMECPTPNSGRRSVRVVLIPSMSNIIKIVTVMWADES